MSETTTDRTTDLLDYPVRRAAGCPFAPAPQMREIAAEKPLFKVRIWDGKEPWVVTRYAEARALFTDQRVSSDYHHPEFPHMHEGMKALGAMGPRTMFNTDGLEHARFRRMLAKTFTPKRLEVLRPLIQKHVDEHIDAMLAAGNSADLVRALALPVPSEVICELLGVPYEDHAFFQRHTEIGFDMNASPEEQQQSSLAMLGYLNDLVAAKVENPGEDALSDMAEHVRAGELEVWEAALQGVGMLVAGHETTANMVALSVIALLERPDQLALIRDTEDPKVLATAIDELMRFMSIVQSGQRRVALEDIEIGGEVIRAGDGIMLDLPTANFDSGTFEEPDRLDLERANAAVHLGFGFGAHQCIGLHLARIELGIVLQTLFRRIPELRLAKPVDEIEFKYDSLVYGVHALPVAW